MRVNEIIRSVRWEAKELGFRGKGKKGERNGMEQ